MRLTQLAVLCLINVMLSQSVFAFADLGHKMIAKAAWPLLTQDAQQHAIRVLSYAKKPQHNHERAFVNASVWADHIKRHPQYDYLKPLHYVNLPKNATRYVQSRDCPDRQCVVEAINDFSAQLKTGNPQQQLRALRMLIHLIGDIHQPLHAGLFSDRGGNRYPVKYKGKGLSLHRFWDNELVKRFDTRLARGAKVIATTQLNTSFSLDSPAIWAQQSHSMTVTSLYLALEKNELSDAYLRMADQIMKAQLSRAAKRLAMWLNQVWEVKTN